jgi:UDP-glucose:glycoprotein glucosyltransferase
MRLILKERAIVNYLTDLGLPVGQAIELLTHPTLSNANSGAGALDGLYDASDRQEDGLAISYLNDLEKDARYEHWFTGTQTVGTYLVHF